MTVERLPQPDGEGEVQLSAQLLAAVRDLQQATPAALAAALRLLGEPSEGRGRRRLRAVGRARKVSVSMPDDLTAAVQQRVGRGDFSQYVSEAVARQLELDLLGELAAQLEAEHGPVDPDLLIEARRSWPDVQ